MARARRGVVAHRWGEGLAIDSSPVTTLRGQLLTPTRLDADNSRRHYVTESSNLDLSSMPDAVVG